MRLLIDKLIEEKGLKERFIADKVGVSVRTILNWRKGETIPRLDQAVKLADVLGVEVTELYDKE